MKPGVSSRALASIASVVFVTLGGGTGDAGWAAAAPSIRALGSVPGNTQSGSPKLSADGSAAAGFAGGTSASREPFRWTAAGGMTALPDVTPLPATDARAYGISGDGQGVVGGYNLSGASFPHNQRAFHYSAPAGVVSALVNPFGNYGITATAASFDGGTIVGDIYDSGSANAGYRYSAQNGFQLLKSPTGSRLAPATAITPDGAVIVGGGIASGGGRSGGYHWTAAGGYNPLPFDATAVSADGGVVVGYDQISNPLGGEPLLTDEAFIWRQSTGQSVSLGDLPGGTFRSQALAISGDGSVVVGSSASGAEMFDAFIWDAGHGMRQLRQVFQEDFGIDMTGWRLIAATTISADGRYIGGSGYDPTGQSTAWIAQVPEPTGASAALISLAALSARRGRRSGTRARSTGNTRGSRWRT